MCRNCSILHVTNHFHFHLARSPVIVCWTLLANECAQLYFHYIKLLLPSLSAVFLTYAHIFLLHITLYNLSTTFIVIKYCWLQSSNTLRLFNLRIFLRTIDAWQSRHCNVQNNFGRSFTVYSKFVSCETTKLLSISNFDRYWLQQESKLYGMITFL